MSTPLKTLSLFEAIEIETLNVCTRKCWFCKWGQLRAPEERTQMPWECINKIIDDLVSLNYTGRLSWFLINEPLSDPRMPEIIEKSRQKLPGARLVLGSNGDLLTQEKYELLVSKGLDLIAVSMYDDAAKERLRKIKGDKIALFDRTHPFFEKQTVTNRGGNLQLKDHCRQSVIPDDLITKSCARPTTSMWVQPSGNTSLCCEDMYGDVITGNVMTTSLGEIWFNSPVYKHYRETLSTTGRKNLKLCETCSYGGASAGRKWPVYINTCSLCKATLEKPNAPCGQCNS